jgi:PST family polysaccharide transporter
MVQKILPIVALLTGGAVLMIMTLGPLMLKLFYGEKFSPAVPVLQVLMFLPLIIAFSNIMGIQIMLNLKMDKIFFRVTACGAALSVFLNLIMIKHWGYIGTSVNWIVTEFLICITMFFILRRKGVHPIDLRYFRLSAYKRYFQAFKARFVPAFNK